MGNEDRKSAQFHTEDPIVRNTSQIIVRGMLPRAVLGRHAEDAVRQATTQSSPETLAKIQPRPDASNKRRIRSPFDPDTCSISSSKLLIRHDTL